MVGVLDSALNIQQRAFFDTHHLLDIYEIINQ